MFSDFVFFFFFFFFSLKFKIDVKLKFHIFWKQGKKKKKKRERGKKEKKRKKTSRQREKEKKEKEKEKNVFGPNGEDIIIEKQSKKESEGVLAIWPWGPRDTGSLQKQVHKAHLYSSSSPTARSTASSPLNHRHRHRRRQSYCCISNSSCPLHISLLFFFF